jgi:hypothetical protein
MAPASQIARNPATSSQRLWTKMVAKGFPFSFALIGTNDGAV